MLAMGLKVRFTGPRQGLGDTDSFRTPAFKWLTAAKLRKAERYRKWVQNRPAKAKKRRKM